MRFPRAAGPKGQGRKALEEVNFAMPTSKLIKAGVESNVKFCVVEQALEF